MSFVMLLIVPIYFVLWLVCFGHCIKNKNTFGFLILIFTNPVAPLLYGAIYNRK